MEEDEWWDHFVDDPCDDISGENFHLWFKLQEGIVEGKIRRCMALRPCREVQVSTDLGHATCGV